MTGLSTTTLAAAAAIIFTGHLVKGVSGFGSALFAVPLLLLILDVKVVTPTFLLFDFVSGALMVASTWRSIERRLLLLLLSGMVAGTAIGTWVLLSFSHEILKRILGVLVTVWAITMLLDQEPDMLTWGQPMGSALAPVSGFLGGALGAVFSVNGPPIIIYLSQVLDDKQAFRATLYGVFFADACYRMVLFGAGGLLDRQVLGLALLMAPFLVAGIAVGSWLQGSMQQKAFRKVIAAVLMVTGVLLLV